MKNLYVACSLVLFAISASAQTKHIAHRSHSGRPSSFTILSDGNFGQAPNRLIKSAQLDSVIFVNESKAILVTSMSCKRRTDTVTTRWNPGREEALNHPLFSQQHSLDSIKETIRNYYHFTNNVNDVKFIGYDNNKPVKEDIKPKDEHGKSLIEEENRGKKKKKSDSLLIISTGSPAPPNNPSIPPAIFFGIALFPLLALLTWWKFWLQKVSSFAS